MSTWNRLVLPSASTCSGGYYALDSGKCGSIYSEPSNSFFCAQVNPEIIGGLVVDIGDKHLDLSLNTRIRKIEQLLTQSAA